jgi:uncharacterized membrane protein YebE (DUF533 family)
MNTTQNRRNQMTSSLNEAYSTSREMMADNPLTSTVIAFGAGAAIGVLIGHMIASSGHEQTTASAMEKLGRQVCDSLRTNLPESIARHLPR